MITNHRPNILHRPKMTEPSKSFAENIDKDYQKEQERLRVRAERLAESEERLRRAIYRCPEDVQRNRLEVSEAMAASRAAKLQQQEEQAELEAPWLKPSESASLYDTSRPWLVPTHVIDVSEAAIARRQQEWLDLQANKQAVTQGLLAQKKHVELERQSIREAALKEEGFWNRGASSEKWITPERRVKAPSSFAWQEAGKGAPYGAPGVYSPRQPVNPSTALIQGTAVPQAASPQPVKLYPWSWDIQPKA